MKVWRRLDVGECIKSDDLIWDKDYKNSFDPDSAETTRHLTELYATVHKIQQHHYYRLCDSRGDWEGRRLDPEL